ncbi:UbiA family prenyltransferase [Streptomyces sp. NPDC006879]|uniref:UbiA family prenyltransferase n=1 Tax=Streptomyces sp. NPDC006879 TaxID=3364767 RepID=UPI0036CB79C5
MPTTTGEASRPCPPTAPPGAARAVRGLLSSCHPLPAGAVTVFSVLLSITIGPGLAAGAVTVGAVAAGQLSVGWCNDRADLTRDRVTDRRDKPLVTGAVRPEVVTAAALTALVVCATLSLLCGPPAAAVHLVGVAAAWWYNLHLKRTALSWLPYAVAFGLLPAFVTLSGTPAVWPPPWLMAAAALLGTGAHFANVLPDLEDDVRTGVHGLGQRLGARRCAGLAAALLLASTVVLVSGPPGPPTPAGRALLAAASLLALAAPLLPRGRLPFLAAMVLAGGDLVQLLLAG